MLLHLCQCLFKVSLTIIVYLSFHAFGRHIYSLCINTVEPVFGNINTSRRLNRFGLRGKTRVNALWLMYCMGHNIDNFSALRLDTLKHWTITLKLGMIRSQKLFSVVD